MTVNNFGFGIVNVVDEHSSTLDLISIDHIRAHSTLDVGRKVLVGFQ